MTFSIRATKYFCNLKTPIIKAPGVDLLNPYKKEDVKITVSSFFKKFYPDDNERIFVFGINPGRFGGGLTGIAFTDPVALRENCGIENNLGYRKELSSKFIYLVAEKYGGVEKFLSKVFLTALFPFAIIKDGKNYNYYDDKLLLARLIPAIVRNVKSQIDFGARRDFVILLGKKNAEFFIPINKKYKFFKNVFVLEHPRYIMQYKLRLSSTYIKKYINTINSL